MDQINVTQPIYVVLELAYFEDYLSGVRVYGVYDTKDKAKIAANNINKNKDTQYVLTGKIFEKQII